MIVAILYCFTMSLDVICTQIILSTFRCGRFYKKDCVSGLLQCDTTCLEAMWLNFYFRILGFLGKIYCSRRFKLFCDLNSLKATAKFVLSSAFSVKFLKRKNISLTKKYEITKTRVQSISSQTTGASLISYEK